MYALVLALYSIKKEINKEQSSFFSFFLSLSLSHFATQWHSLKK